VHRFENRKTGPAIPDIKALDSPEASWPLSTLLTPGE
jgi:hypothetical protein